MNCSYLFAVIVAGLLIVNIGAWSGLIDKYLVSWSWTAVSQRFQYWRLITGVLYCNTGPLQGLIHFSTVIGSLKHIDERCYCSTRKLMLSVIASMVTALVLGTLYPDDTPFIYWLSFLVYLESREYPDVFIRVMLFTTQEVYYPLILMLILDNSKGKKHYNKAKLLAYLSAHIFYFLDDVLSVRFNISPILRIEKSIVWLFKTLTFSNKGNRQEREVNNRRRNEEINNNDEPQEDN